MWKWLFVLAVVVVLLGTFASPLSRRGLWKLPGDLRIHRNGRDYFFPITSTILLSLAFSLLLRIFRI
jgi:hypothetical protein